MARRIEPVASPLALMGVIYFLSAQPDLSTGLGTLDTVLRKIAHGAIYSLLCLLWWRPLRDTALGPRRAALAALVISVGYAVTDEYHQTFVEGRHGSAVDVAIDAAGAAAAAALVGRVPR